jgi:hypothetical protein
LHRWEPPCMYPRAERWLVALVWVVLCAATADPAAAISITNRDDKEYKITVLEEDGAKTTDHVLKPNQILEGICLKGCVIRLNDNEEDEYELVEGTEVVSIEEGYLYYDQEETPGSAAPGTVPGSPPAKKE